VHTPFVRLILTVASKGLLGCSHRLRCARLPSDSRVAFRVVIHEPQTLPGEPTLHPHQVCSLCNPVFLDKSTVVSCAGPFAGPLDGPHPRGGIVAVENPLAAQAGATILAHGGNAIDAIVATNAVMGVIEPMINGIGGDLFAIVYDAKTHKLYGLNASGWSPQKLTIDFLASKGVTNMPHLGIDSVTVPGAVDGWSKLLSRFGTKNFSEVLAPAIYYAREGVPVPEWDAEYWHEFADETGFALQDRGALFTLDPSSPDALAGHKRPLHTIIPAFMERGDDRIVFGIMGGFNQAQAHAQFVSDVVDFGMNIQACLESPRFTKLTFHGCDVAMEDRIPESIRNALIARGHQIELRGDYSDVMGGGQAVQRDFKSGVNYGAPDPRKDGEAIPELPSLRQ